MQKLKLRIKTETERLAKGTPTFVGTSPDIIWPRLHFLGPDVADELNKIWMEPCIATSNLLIRKTQLLLDTEKESLYKELATYKVTDTDFERISRFMVNKTKDYQPLRDRRVPEGGLVWYTTKDGRLSKNPAMDLINTTGERIPGSNKRPLGYDNDAGENTRFTKRQRIEYKDTRRRTPERKTRRNDNHQHYNQRERENSPPRRRNNQTRYIDKEQTYRRTQKEDNRLNTYKKQQFSKRGRTPDRDEIRNQPDNRRRKDTRRFHTPERKNNINRPERKDKRDYTFIRNHHRSGN